MIRIRFLGRSRTSSQRLGAPHYLFGWKSVPVFFQDAFIICLLSPFVNPYF